MQGLLKRAVQLLPLITLPLTYQLPQGLFVYWVTTFGFTTSQMLVQRSAWWKRFFYKGIREESARIHRMTTQAKPLPTLLRADPFRFGDGGEGEAD